MKHPKTWAVVMSGDRARIVQGLEGPDRDAPDPIELISPTGATHPRDHLEDRSGRSFSSGAAGRRSGMEPGTDPVRRDMEDFAKETLDYLDKRRRAGAFERLAVVAAPKMLGILRPVYSDGLRDALVLEHSANLVKLPDDELRAALKELVPARLPE